MIEVKCEQSPICTDEKCLCEEWNEKSDLQKQMMTLNDFHANQMGVLSNLIRQANES